MRCCDVCGSTERLQSVAAGFDLSLRGSRDQREQPTWLWYEGTTDFCPACRDLLKAKDWAALADRALGMLMRAPAGPPDDRAEPCLDPNPYPDLGYVSTLQPCSRPKGTRPPRPESGHCGGPITARSRTARRSTS